MINDRVFINNASIGAYPRMVWERNRARQRGIPKPLASALAAVATWLELRTVVVRLDLDGREVVRRSPFVLVGNSEYELEGTRFGRRATMTDGKLSLYVAPGSGRRTLSRCRRARSSESWRDTKSSKPGRRTPSPWTSQVVESASPSTGRSPCCRRLYGSA